MGGSRGHDMAADLEEEYSRFVLPELGRRRATWWYWRQVIRSLPAALRGDARRRASRGSQHGTFFSSVGRELPYAVRAVYRAPRFSLAVILILGLGVGSGASVFALVDMFLFRPPSQVHDPGRVRRVTFRENRPPFGEFVSASLSWVDYERLHDGAQSFTGVAAWFPWRMSLGRGPAARNIVVTLATPSFFTVLGVEAALGRFYTDAEDVLGLNPAPCVASDALWRRELGGDERALGRVLTVGGMTCTVVGVTPRGFNGITLETVHLWLPLRAAGADAMGPDPELWAGDRYHWVRILARLAPGVTDQAANQDATAAYRGFTERRRDPDLVARAELQSIMPGRAVRNSVVDVSTLLLAGGALLLVLIAANLANLFIVRDLDRARETAVRVALGSPRWRLFVTRVLEAGVLGAGAGLVGLAIATWLGPVVRSTLVTGVDFATGAVTLRVALATVGMALFTGLILAAVSAVRVTRSDPAALLVSAGGARSDGDRRGTRLRLGLVGLQAALSMALLVASLGFVSSFRRAAGVDLGFERRGLLVADVSLADLNYSTEEYRQFFREIWTRVRNLPGVTSASLGSMTPWMNNQSEDVAVPGRDTLPPVPAYGSPLFDAVTPDYLETMQLTMRSGRWFTASDGPGRAPVIVINEALGDLYWPSENPIGRCMYVGDRPTPCREVIGVVGNHRFTGRLEDEPVAAYFMPLGQADAYDFTPRLFVRTDREVELTIPTIRQVVQGAVPNLPAADVIPLERRFAPLIAPWRLGSYAFTGLGVLATLVGTVGLFSLLSYVVAERRREFAIRAAVGATSRQIAIPVVRQGIATVALGVAAGLGLAAVSSTWLGPLLFRTRLIDPLALAVSASALFGVALLATLLPARAAATGDPMEALRLE